MESKISKLLEISELADFGLEIIDTNSGKRKIEKYHKNIFYISSNYFKKLFTTSLKTDFYLDNDRLPIYRFETKCIQSAIDVFNSFYGVPIDYENIHHIMNVYYIKNMLGVDLESNFFSEIIFSKPFEIDCVDEIINIFETHYTILDEITINNLVYNIRKCDENYSKLNTFINNLTLFKKLDYIMAVIDYDNKNICYLISILTGAILSTIKLYSSDIDELIFNYDCSEIIIGHHGHIIFYDIVTGIIKKQFHIPFVNSKIRFMTCTDNWLIISANEIVRILDINNGNLIFCFKSIGNFVSLVDNNICLENGYSDNSLEIYNLSNFEKIVNNNTYYKVGNEIFVGDGENGLKNIFNDKKLYLDFELRDHCDNIVFREKNFIYKNGSDSYISGVIIDDNLVALERGGIEKSFFYYKNMYINYSNKYFELLLTNL